MYYERRLKKFFDFIEFEIAANNDIESPINPSTLLLHSLTVFFFGRNHFFV
jgi:hypothetical protein